MKSQPTIREKTFPNDTSDKELISKYKELLQLNIKKTKKSDFKMAENLNRYFSKQGV